MRHDTDISQTDQDLVDRVIRGNTDNFKIIIRNTEALVAQIIFKMIPNNVDREDIAQDVYLKAFQNLRNFRFQSKLSTWIAQICYNICLNYLEKKKLILPGSFSAGKDSYTDPLEILSNNHQLTGEDTEKNINQKELYEILKTETERLTPVYKTLITLYHNEELSYAEIGQITNLPEGTVKSYLFRARKELKENILLRYKNEEL